MTILKITFNLQAGIDGPTHDVQAGAKSAEELSKELMANTFEDWQQVYA